MVTSPLYDTTRKMICPKAIQALSLSALTQSTNAANKGRILLKGTPSKGILFRNDPYGLPVLECREYPTPVFTSVKESKLAPAPQSAAAPIPATSVPAVQPKLAAAAAAPEAAPRRPTPPQQRNAKSEHVAAPSTKPSAASKAPAVTQPQAEENAPALASKGQLAVCRVLVEFKRGEDIYISHIDHKIGDMIVVEGDRGQDMGTVLELLPVKGSFVAGVVGLASDKDRDTLASLRKEEAAAVRLCQQRVREHNLKMKIEDVEFQFDGGKITIYYSSNVSIDFRQLQRQLFRDFRCRVWLRTVPASS